MFLKLKDAGFTLVEVMVTVALIAVSVIFVATQQTKQAEHQNSLRLQQVLRQKVNESINHALEDPKFILPIAGIAYVACLKDDGSNAKAQSAGNVSSLSFTPVAMPSFDAFRSANLGDLCHYKQGGDGLELHAATDPNDPSRLYVHGIILGAAGAGDHTSSTAMIQPGGTSKPARPFSAASAHMESSVSLGLF